MMKISIIISAHKESPYLIECIRSCIDQNFPKEDYEIILSSDGAILKEIATQYDLRYSFSIKQNHSAALNKAVKKAHGIWIKEIHYDDTLTPNCLKDLWAIAENKEASLIYANAINFWPNGKKAFFNAPKKITIDSLWPPIKCPVHSATYLFRKDDFMTVGGRDVAMEDSEEYDYYINLLFHGYKFVHCNSITARYRRHKDQKTERYTKQKREWVKNYLLQKYNNNDSRDNSVTSLELK